MELITLEGLQTPQFINRKNDVIANVASSEAQKIIDSLNTNDYLTIAGEALQSKYNFVTNKFQPAIDAVVTTAKQEYKPVAIEVTIKYGWGCNFQMHLKRLRNTMKLGL